MNNIEYRLSDIQQRVERLEKEASSIASAVKASALVRYLLLLINIAVVTSLYLLYMRK